MPCICGHKHDEHESGRDYGYHNYKCKECHCQMYYPVRRFENDRKEGKLQSGKDRRMYEEYISTVERNRLHD